MSITTVEQSGTLAAGAKSKPIRLDLYASGAQSLIRFNLTTNQDCAIHASNGSSAYAYTNPDTAPGDLVAADYGNLPHDLEDQDHTSGSMGYEIPVNWAARRWEFQIENTSGSSMNYVASVGSGNE